MSDPIDYSLEERRRRRSSVPAAQSNYGQIRLTVTFEPNGRASFRALAKRPQDTWREQHVFHAGSDEFAVYPPTFDEALRFFSLVAEGLRWQGLTLD